MDTATLLAITAAIGAAVTAVATIALWRVTAVLAKETTRMADATGQAQIVSTLRPNKWTMMYADLTISNSGNASAFDVRMEFSPPLTIDSEGSLSAERPMPFQNISILRPGESLSSNIGQSFPLLEKNYRVTTSWLRHPEGLERESLSYTLSMADSKHVTVLGTSDPLVQIAEEVKHIREDWRYVASGSRRTEANIYTSADRLHERRQQQRDRRGWNQRAEAHRTAAAEASSSVVAPDVNAAQPPVSDGN